MLLTHPDLSNVLHVLLPILPSFVISGFRREVPENCALLRYYAASSGNFLQTFRDNLFVPVLRVVPKYRYQITTNRCLITHRRADLITIIFFHKSPNSTVRNFFPSQFKVSVVSQNTLFLNTFPVIYATSVIIELFEGFLEHFRLLNYLFLMLFSVAGFRFPHGFI